MPKTAIEAAVAPLTIALFGPMRVLVQGQQLPHLRSRKARWLLALLVLRHHRPVERELLAGMLWPDLDQTQAFANLRPVLSELRKALGEQGNRIQSPDRLTLLLELAYAQVDILQFDAAIKSGKLPDLERAVALYQGPLLEECREEWILPERAAREQRCLQALLQLGDAALTTGTYEMAGGYFQRAAELDPWLDTARRGWMEALAKLGDNNGALQVYREFLNRLRNDPNAAPDAQTSALYQRLRAEVRQQTGVKTVPTAQATPPPTLTGYLPRPLTEIVGREEQTSEVAARLRRSRLVTLTGLGGIGKTRLALEVASEYRGEYADGVWLVALEALSDGNQIAQQIASVLGVKEEPGRVPLQSVTEHLRQKRLLLVLDNCEHLLEASAHIVTHLLQACGEVRILATSREALGIAGETVWTVPALTAPPAAHLPQERAPLLRELTEYESVQLFVERTQAVQQRFVLTDANALAVARVCSQLEGIPLAIELAAARGATLTVEQIAERLDDHLSLRSEGSTLPYRQQTLRATLDWSYGLLRESERRLLCRLSVFVGGWRLEAAEAVCAGEGIASSQVLDLLLSLIDKSLVVFGGQSQEADGRYHLLEMVRQYAAQGLQASGEAEAVKRRHQAWCLAFAEQAEPALRTGEQQVWLRRLESEHGNLRAALACSLETGVKRGGNEEPSQPPDALRFCKALHRFWYLHAHVEEGRTWCQSALEAAGAQERTELRAKVLNAIGMLVWVQSDYISAHAYFEESLAISREIGDRSGIAASLNSLGNTAHIQGDYVAAHAYYEQSLALQQEIGNRAGIATAHNNLGNITLLQGDFVAALAHYEASLTIDREIGDRQGIAAALSNLGKTYQNQGDNAAAQAYFEEGLTINREIGDRLGTASCLTSLGNVLYALGDYAAAQACYQESLTTAREFGDRQSITRYLHNLANAVYRRGDHVTAKAYHKECLAIRKEIGAQDGIVLSLEAFAVLTAAETTTVTAPMEMGTAEASKTLDAGMRKAVRLMGAAQALREQIGALPSPEGGDKYEGEIAQARAVLGEDAFSTALEEGRILNWEQAVSCAMEEEY